jgi:hypothetical protein
LNIIENESFKIKEADEVPLNANTRISELLKLPLKDKQSFVPEVGLRMQIGPFIYEVKVTNPSQLRFTLGLQDVVIEKKEDKKADVPLIIAK